MRVVVAVKTGTGGGGSASRLTRYIADRDRDERLEGAGPRALFSESDDRLTYREADRRLAGRPRPEKDELLHLAVSFREEDFAPLGADEEARRRALVGVTREALREVGESLGARRLIWVAGLHRNTDHPHLHLVIQRGFIEGDTGRLRRLGRLPERMLPRKGGPEGGPDPGAIGGAFESAIDRRLERTRRGNLTERPLPSNDRAAAEFSAPRRTPAANSDRLAESVMHDHPSPAGRDLILEILARDGEEKDAGRRLVEALRPRDLDDPDYVPPHGLADRLGASSRELRDLYERGAWLKGDTLLLPAESHDAGEPHEDFRANLRRRAAQHIPDPAKAREFAGLARAIAGEGADARAEREVYNHYLGRADGGARGVERALGEMRALAAALAPLETRESVEAHLTPASFNEDRPDRKAAGGGGDDRESVKDGSRVYNTAARRVNLGDEPPRLPAGLSDTFKAYLFGKALAAVDRAVESGADPRAVAAGVTAECGAPGLRDHIDYISTHAGLGAPGRNSREDRRGGRDAGGRVLRVSLAGDGGKAAEVSDLRGYRDLLLAARAGRVGLSARTSPGGPDFAAAAEEEWGRVRRFLGDYVEARLRDPETRELNRSIEFRGAHARINGARDERELSLAAAAILRENVALHEDRGPDRPRPLDARQRALLFFGRSPRHFTPEMRRLKLDWGLSRAERGRRVIGLTEGRDEPSQNLSSLLEELDARGSRRAVAHFQASVLSGERMAVKGPRDLQDLYLRLAPHERNYLYLRGLDKQSSLGRDQIRGSIPAAGRQREDGFPRQGAERSEMRGHDAVHERGQLATWMRAMSGYEAPTMGELGDVTSRPNVRGWDRQSDDRFEGGRTGGEGDRRRTRSDERASGAFER